MKYEQLNEDEQYKYTTIQSCIQGDITNQIAADILGMKVRQVQRLKRAVESNGINGIRHGLKDKISNHKLAPAIERKVVAFLKQKKHHDFGPTFAQEKLLEGRGMSLGVDTVRAIMIRNGLWNPKKNVPKPYTGTVVNQWHSMENSSNLMAHTTIGMKTVKRSVY